MTKIKRRNFIQGAAVFSAAGVLLPSLAKYGFASPDTVVASISPLGLADDLANPPEIQSVDGQLRAKMKMAFTSKDLPSGPASLRIFNDSLPGPTLRITPGDTLEINFSNDMPENTDKPNPLSPNIPNSFNTTNVHYHGFHVSPKGNSDNVYLNIEPGQKFNYIVKVPDDHPAGNYWYHPHRHGSVAAQVASGAAGMAIIKGALDDVPEVKACVERVMVIQAPIPGIDGILKSEEPIWPLDAERDFLINGQYKPCIYIREGEVQHWRVLHAGDAQFFPLRLDGLSLYEIGFDGNPLPNAAQIEEAKLAPGNRINLLVKGEKAGAYVLRRPAFNQGKQPLPEVDIADVIVLPADSPKVSEDVPFGKEIPQGELPKNHILTDIEASEVTGYRKMVLGFSEVKGFFHDTEFTINGQPFDPRRDDVTAKLGSVEEWTLVNTTPFPHPIHIHVNPFQVVSINGVADERRPWQDTVAVPAGGTVVFRTRFTDFDGRYVMHCHILPHEDTGMMINVNIEA